MLYILPLFIIDRKLEYNFSDIDINKRIYHMTMNMFLRVHIEADMVIFDECHHEQAEKTTSKIEGMKCRVIVCPITNLIQLSDGKLASGAIMEILTSGT